MERRLSVLVLSVHIRAVFDEHLSNRGLVSMSRSVQRRCSPVLIVAVNVYISAGAQKEGDNCLMPLPRGAVQGGRTISIASVNQVSVGVEQNPELLDIAGLGRLDKIVCLRQASAPVPSSRVPMVRRSHDPGRPFPHCVDYHNRRKEARRDYTIQRGNCKRPNL